jgi:Zn-dependent M28 family amino/carboxypeptidase
MRPVLSFVALAVLTFAACSGRASGPDPATADSGREQGTASAEASPAGPPAGRGPAETVAGPAEFQGGRAIEHIRSLSVTIGPRVAGSEEDAEAAAYIAAQLEAAGYQTEIQEFTFEDGLFRPATLRAGDEDLGAYAMGGTAAGSVTAPGVYVGLGDADGIGGQDLTGRVAVADRGVLRFKEKYENVRAAGAVALVIINHEAGELLGHVNTDAEIPVVGTSQETGERLREAVAAGRPLTVATVDSAETVSRNVLARAGEGPCLVVVGGHADSVPGAPGALDNASGAAAVLELARAFAADGIDPGLCFAAFGAEESGLHGSAAMAAEMEERGELPQAMVNLDMLGLGDRVDLIGDSALTSLALAESETLGIAAKVTDLPMMFGSDHQSFQATGVPVVYLTTSELGKFHTPEDTLETIDPESVEDGGDLAYAVIARILAQVARG